MQLEHILAESAATDHFRADVRTFMKTGAARRVETEPFAPRIKVLRLIAQLLATESDLRVDAIRIDAASGCSDFVGAVDVACEDGTRRFEFAWDCRWRAQQEGWTDCFGFPDQIRAAQEFEWRCFRVWREVEQSTVAAEEEGVGAH
jgi:hypothetical protein